jgi:hypothetical protein
MAKRMFVILLSAAKQYYNDDADGSFLMTKKRRLRDGMEKRETGRDKVSI